MGLVYSPTFTTDFIQIYRYIYTIDASYGNLNATTWIQFGWSWMILIHSRLFAQMYDTLDAFLYVSFVFFAIHFVRLSRVVYEPLNFFDSGNMTDLSFLKSLSLSTKTPDAVPFSRERFLGLTTKPHSHHLTPVDHHCYHWLHLERLY